MNEKEVYCPKFNPDVPAWIVIFISMACLANSSIDPAIATRPLSESS